MAVYVMDMGNVIQYSNDPDWGDWGQPEYDPYGTSVYGKEVQIVLYDNKFVFPANSSRMFYGAISINSFEGWDMSNITNADHMFADMFDTTSTGKTLVFDLSNTGLGSNVYADNMFDTNTMATTIEFPAGFSVASKSRMFANCTELTHIIFHEEVNWGEDTDDVIANCNNLHNSDSIELSTGINGVFDYQQVDIYYYEEAELDHFGNIIYKYHMSNTTDQQHSWKKWYPGDYKGTLGNHIGTDNVVVAVFDGPTELPRDCDEMFKYMSGLEGEENLDTSKVRYFDSMFADFKATGTTGHGINMTNWDCSQAVSIDKMFEYCEENRIFVSRRFNFDNSGQLRYSSDVFTNSVFDDGGDVSSNMAKSDRIGGYFMAGPGWDIISEIWLKEADSWTKRDLLLKDGGTWTTRSIQDFEN